jgi:hypothetical protein
MHEQYDRALGQYELPDPGSLIAFQHRVWRVIAVNRIDESEWTDDERKRVSSLYKEEFRARHAPVHIVIRPAEVTSTDVRARDHDKHHRIQGANYRWHVYQDEHYPVCAQCGEPTPCRELLGKREAERAVAIMSRYEDPNLCPQCQEPFTRRQKKHTFTENVKIPAGPPVTFHMRGECGYGAAEYERELLTLHPDRTPELHCPGWITNHNDGTYECTAGERCPGPAVGHEGLQACLCELCNVNGPFDCHPMAWATRRTE